MLTAHRFYVRFIALVVLMLAGSSVFSATVTNVDFARILHDRIDRDKIGVGVVIGLINPQGAKIFSCGRMRSGDAAEVNGDTVFEIGSITKIFTSLVLQQMADAGKLSLHDPVQKFLPAGVKVPTYKNREITMVDLATHTSGLPRLPFGVWHLLTHFSDPYASFREKELYQFLNDYRLKREIGQIFEYSNLGLMLLGQALALKDGTDYETMVQNRISRPLQMESTAITLSPELKARFASGHVGGEVVKNWSSPLPGDGGLRSTVNDLLKFLSAEIGLTSNALSSAMVKTQVPRHATEWSSIKVGLGWMVENWPNQKKLIWHDGGTAGYTSWIGFEPSVRQGVVVLSNSDDDVDEFGEMLLKIFMGKQIYREPVPIAPAASRPCAGKYLNSKMGTFFITWKKGKLYSQLGKDDDADEIRPQSDTSYFNNEHDGEYIFEKSGNNMVTNLTYLHHGKISQFVRIK